MDELRRKPKSIKLKSVEAEPVSEHWQTDFELSVQLFGQGAKVKGVRTDPRGAVIVNWMRHGDFRPLAAAIAEGQAIDRGVGRALAELIAEDRLKVKKPVGSRGAAKQPRLFARNARIFLAFQNLRQSVAYEAALQKVADDFRVSSETVRRAADEVRKFLGK